jgi:hypothetical protein
MKAIGPPSYFGNKPRDSQKFFASFFSKKKAFFFEKKKQKTFDCLSFRNAFLENPRRGRQVPEE